MQKKRNKICKSRPPLLIFAYKPQKAKPPYTIAKPFFFIIIYYFPMRGLNKVCLIGNLGKDPEVQTFDGGLVLAKYSLATTEVFKNTEGAPISQTEWHNIVMWRESAELAARFLKKGSRVYLEGKLKTRDYEDKNGIKRYTTEIVADTFLMLDKPATSQEQAAADLVADASNTAV